MPHAWHFWLASAQGNESEEIMKTNPRSRKWTAVALVMALIFSLMPVNLLQVSAAAPVDITAKFKDPRFRYVIYSCINKTAPEPIYDTDVVNIGALDVEGEASIRDLSGIEYLTSLREIWLSYNYITTLPKLPPSVKYIDCHNNRLTKIVELPPYLETLRCDGNFLTSLPPLPSTLKSLNSSNNQLMTLPELPSGLETMNIDMNQLSKLPDLPSSLRYFHCSANRLTALPALPHELETLDCSKNQLTTLPPLSQLSPFGVNINCDYNRITALPALPSSYTLSVKYNQLTSVDVSGTNMWQLDLRYNNMTSESDVTGFEGNCDSHP
jgi:Leucine-rich repeat (LRR) protein